MKVFGGGSELPIDSCVILVTEIIYMSSTKAMRSGTPSTRWKQSDFL
jgi:hypothetical protein